MHERMLKGAKSALVIEDADDYLPFGQPSEHDLI